MSLLFCIRARNFEIYIVKATAVHNIWRTSLSQGASRTKRKRGSFSSAISMSSTGFICLLDNMQYDSVIGFLSN